MRGLPSIKTLQVTPLSPVHMGTDEDYTPTNYVIDNDVLYEFDEFALLALPDNERDKLDKTLAGPATADLLRKVQRLFYDNRDSLMPSALNVVKVSESVAAMYRARVGKVANLEQGGSEVQNRLEIERASYHPGSRRLYLPGTGLKGAMRTALLDSINAGSPLPRDLRDERVKDGSGIARRADSELQKRLFKGAFSEDPLSLVHVDDCGWHGPGEMNSAEILFAVNRKKYPVEKGGVLLQSRAEQQGLYQLLECAAPLRFRAFRGQLRVPDLTSVAPNSPGTPKMCFGFTDIAAACNRFYRPILEAELEMLRKRGYLDTGWHDIVRQLLGDQNLTERLESNQAFLLRVGRHSGADAVTLKGVSAIRIMKGKGSKIWEPEAKTTWLAATDRNDQRCLRPFGWLLVEMFDPGEKISPWSQAEALTVKAAAVASAWLQQVEDKQAELARQLVARQHKAAREAEEKAEREAAEAAKIVAEQARLEAKRQAHEAAMQAMDPLEREVESFEQVIDAIKALEDEKWTDHQLPKVVLFIRQRMEREGTWCEKSKKKNPAKDKAYQRTMTVMKYFDRSE